MAAVFRARVPAAAGSVDLAASFVALLAVPFAAPFEAVLATPLVRVAGGVAVEDAVFAAFRPRLYLAGADAGATPAGISV